MRLHFVVGVLQHNNEGTSTQVMLGFEHDVNYNRARYAKCCIVLDDEEDMLKDLGAADPEYCQPGASFPIGYIREAVDQGDLDWQPHPEAGNLIFNPEDLDGVVI